MGGKSGGGSATTTQTSDPWSQQQPYLKSIYEQASQLPIQQAYPFATYVPYSPTTSQAIGMQTERALAGSPVQAAGQAENLRTLRGEYLGQTPGLDYLAPTLSGGNLNVGAYPGAGTLSATAAGRGISGYGGVPQLSATAGGDYLYGGPGFDAAYQAAANKIIPQVQGSFESVGRYGGGLAQQAQTQALGDAFAGLYGQERANQLGAAQALAGLSAGERGLQERAAGQLTGLYSQERGTQETARQQAAQLASGTYGAERQRQLGASALAPSLAQADYTDIGQLAAAGTAEEVKAQQALQDAIQRWQFGQQAPIARLQNIASLIGGNVGGVTTTDQPTFSNPLGGALGGAATGASIGSVVPVLGTGVGAGLGAVAGGLSSK